MKPAPIAIDRVRADSFVSIEGFAKSYGSFQAVERIDLGIREGELLALLGPSGSGKSTLLMAIAGFESPSSGDIKIGGRSIIGLPPHRRDIGMVFQRYALFPHMSVAENIAYPLRRRRMRDAEVRKRVNDALALVQLASFARRYPSQLSGGQQQRVALARALVFEPSLLLLDEPLGALDRQLRQQMQSELKLIHRQVGTTMVLVTHDQEEALALADRIAVLEAGKIQQLGTPDELYEKPRNAFVANFIGETNLIPATVRSAGPDRVTVEVEGLARSFEVPRENVCLEDFGGSALLGVRPEDVRIEAAVDAPDGRIIQKSYLGALVNVILQHGPYRITARVPAAEGAILQGETPVRVSFETENVRLYLRT